jgi:hypothetical protein
LPLRNIPISENEPRHCRARFFFGADDAVRSGFPAGLWQKVAPDTLFINQLHVYTLARRRQGKLTLYSWKMGH